MVCPYCGATTDVVNSREQKRNNQIWRRRRCTGCQTVFTTHEAISLPLLFAVKRIDKPEVFEPDKILAELLVDLRHRSDAYEAAKELCASITQKVIKTASNGLILPQDISSCTAEVLKRFDKQAYLRFIAEHASLQG